MLGKRKEPKRKSIAMTLMRDVQGSAAQKLAMFENVRAAGGFANEHPADLRTTTERWGRVVVFGYAGFARLYEIAGASSSALPLAGPPRVAEVACWAHPCRLLR